MILAAWLDEHTGTELAARLGTILAGQCVQRVFKAEQCIIVFTWKLSWQFRVGLLGCRNLCHL